MVPPTAAFPLTVPPGGPLTFAGSAVDDEHELTNVEIRLRTPRPARTRLGRHLGHRRHRRVGTGLCPLNFNGSSYNWTYTTPFNLVPGTYTFQVRATDDLGITTAERQPRQPDRQRPVPMTPCPTP